MKIKDSKTARFLATSLTTGLAASAGNAATVQITLTGNNFSSSTGNNLASDVTGDGISDISFSSTSAYGSGATNFVRVNINGSLIIAARDSASGGTADAKFTVGGHVANSIGAGSFTSIGYNYITFTDARINGGAATDGYLEVRAFSGNNEQRLTLVRVIFDDASTTRPPAANAGALGATFTEFTAVPEPSGLSLLALGAGGLLTRRRRLTA